MNVGETIIHHSFGNSLYHLFISIYGDWGMVEIIVLPTL